MLKKINAHYHLEELISSTVTYGGFWKNIIDGGVFSTILLFGSGRLLVDNSFLSCVAGFTALYVFFVSLANGIIAYYDFNLESNETEYDVLKSKLTRRFQERTIAENAIEVVLYTFAKVIKMIQKLYFMFVKGIVAVWAMFGIYWGMPFDSNLKPTKIIKYMHDYQDFISKGGILEGVFYLLFIIGVFYLFIWFYKLGSSAIELKVNLTIMRWIVFIQL
ncbi:hypothetical protein [Lactococcus lactis]|uniref:Integral membrane protein n=1 Tax=Lactococcus lactis TaxID=1358 RepID=A0AAW8UDR6_9LACT|nr:hypothetical protein [Lactococcus lactis]MDT2882079.1 hypothetical protein [Lactococcus lactis]MDT2946762.1 hypothetical protein [Lactococcus lactis]MDT2947582.1 hypothetical protein [Lactococcus lactis]